jgi:hypothetical protein
MTIPRVKFTKSDGNTGATPPSTLGIAAIIAIASQGSVNIPATYARGDLAYGDFSDGYLAEDVAMVIDQSGNQVVAIRPTTTNAGAYGDITYTGTGTLGGGSFIVGTATPIDDFDLIVDFLTGGTTGSAGITAKVSYDGGLNFGAPIALGTGLVLTVSDQNGHTLASFTLTTAKTVVAGDSFVCSVTGPTMADADLTASLEALRLFKGPWECVAVHGLVADETNVAALDTWLAARELEGKFRFFLAHTALKGSTSEATYLTNMTTAYENVSTDRGGVCADGAFVTQAIRGTVQRRSSLVPVLARIMGESFEVMASRVSDGALAASQIDDANDNPVFHDEALYPGLDDLHLTALRSFDGKPGPYVNLPRVISVTGSDYVFIPHVRMMNQGCEAAWAVLSNLLSSGVLRDKKTGFILESEAQRIESLVNGALDRVFAGKISGWSFVLSRTDNISANSGATLSGTLSIEAPAYITEFDVNTRFVKTITASSTTAQAA